MNETDIGRKIVLVLVVLAVLLIVLFLLMRWPVRKAPPPEIQEVPEETRSVTLFYGDREAEKLLSETREIAVSEGLEEQVKAVLGELVRGPVDDEKVSPIPRGTEILQVFWAEESQTLFLDFSRALVSNHEGGSTSEYFTISMVIRTVAANFPQVRNVQFLVDGYPIETIAGHYAVDEPLNVLKWK